jgi:hypothetical protein
VNNAINAEQRGQPSQPNQSDHILPEFPPAPPPRPNPQFEPPYQPLPGYDDGPIPPGEIGMSNSNEQGNARRTTLLDFLNGN